MKLQFDGQQWRVRIDEDELQRLLAGDAVIAESHAAGRFSLTAVVRLLPQHEASLDGEASHWSLGLPEASVRELAGRLPTRDGLLFELPAATPEQSLQLRFDVDVRDSARRLKAARQGD